MRKAQAMFDGFPDLSERDPAVRTPWHVCLAAWMRLCRDRARQRRALARLEARLLTDIGISRAEAARECAKPFWH